VTDLKKLFVQFHRQDSVERDGPRWWVGKDQNKGAWGHFQGTTTLTVWKYSEKIRSNSNQDPNAVGLHTECRPSFTDFESEHSNNAFW